MAISRHFITVGDRQMQVRRAGQGPALVLLHQSPLSSADLVPVIEDLARDFTCLAFDTAGYGHSDRLHTEQPEIADYAAAVRAALDAIGVSRFLLYGNHTGGCIAAELARQSPERVAACVLDGYVIFTPDEQRDLTANYTPSLAPRWDGSHLVWLWARIRHEYGWFPWHRPGSGMRVDVDLPDAAALQARMIDWLRAGPDYFIGYKAAFRFDGAAVIRQVTVPTLLVTMQPDPLVVHLDRLPALPPGTQVLRTGWERQELIARARAFLRPHAAGIAAPAPIAARATGRPLWQDFLAAGDGTLYARRNMDGAGEPLLLLHGAGESQAALQTIAARFAGDRPVLALDLPGHGESDGSMETACEAVAAALRAAGIDRCIAVGRGAGAMVALDAACAQFVRHVIALDARAPSTEDVAQAGPITPLWHGGHILEAWHRCRDAGLYRPWYRRSRDALHDDPEALLPEVVHRRVVDLFKGGVAGAQAMQRHARAGTPDGPRVTRLAGDAADWRDQVAEILRR